MWLMGMETKWSDLWLLAAVPTLHASYFSHSPGDSISRAPAVWTILLCFKSPGIWERTRKGAAHRDPAMRGEATVHRGRISTGQEAQRQGDPTGQGAARRSRGSTWTLTDDPRKETTLQEEPQLRWERGWGGPSIWQEECKGEKNGLLSSHNYYRIFKE